MTGLLHSFFLVALAEMGDKTQLLALLLAAQFSARGAVIAGILAATLANHALAAWAGQWLTVLAAPAQIRWLVAALFIGIGLWVLVPDRNDQPVRTRGGAFLTTLVVFFFAEMGDKTQLATVTLGAQYAPFLLPVILGTTFGMMAANVPAVLFGHALLERIPVARLRRIAALCFIGFGVLTLLQSGDA